MKRVTPVTPRLAEWTATPCVDPQPEQPEPIALADLPRVVHRAFAAQGWEAQTYWQPTCPQTAPDAPWDEGTLDPDDVPPCPRCGSYELWESMAGNWRCMRCEPPHKSNLLEHKAARYQRLAEEAPRDDF